MSVRPYTDAQTRMNYVPLVADSLTCKETFSFRLGQKRVARLSSCSGSCHVAVLRLITARPSYSTATVKSKFEVYLRFPHNVRVTAGRLRLPLEPPPRREEGAGATGRRGAGPPHQERQVPGSIPFGALHRVIVKVEIGGRRNVGGYGGRGQGRRDGLPQRRNLRA